MTTFFTADTHFNDGSMRSRDFVNRPFKTNTEHDMALILKWNKVVQPGDRVVHLGDFAHENTHRNYLKQVFRQLNGRKLLVIGNHDGVPVLDLGWHKVIKDGIMATQRHEFIVSHHPPKEPKHGKLYLHGHLHTRPPSAPRFPLFDVGVDGHGFLPWSEHELDRLAAQHRRGVALWKGLMKAPALSAKEREELD